MLFLLTNTSSNAWIDSEADIESASYESVATSKGMLCSRQLTRAIGHPTARGTDTSSIYSCCAANPDAIMHLARRMPIAPIKSLVIRTQGLPNLRLQQVTRHTSQQPSCFSKLSQAIRVRQGGHVLDILSVDSLRDGNLNLGKWIKRAGSKRETAIMDIHMDGWLTCAESRMLYCLIR